jgi:hypothetical protein
MSGIFIAIASGQDPAILQPAPGALFAVDQYSASVTIMAQPDVVWTFTGGGVGGTVSRSSGTSGPSIQFTVSTSPPGSAPPCTVNWTVTATLGAFSKSWTVEIEVLGNS